MSDIVTVTINPSIDISTAVGRVEPTRKLRCRSVLRDPGGGGINVARVVCRFGADTTAIFPVGGAIGNLLRRLVSERGIRSLTVDIVEETRESFTVLEEASGQQYRFVLPGPSLSESEWRACLDTLAAMPGRPQFVVASGSLAPGVPTDFYGRVAAVAGGLGARCVVDTSGPALAAAVERGVFLLKPNLGELRQLTGAPLADEAEQLAVCRRLVAEHPIEAVALTLAEAGALLVSRAGAWRARAPNVELVSAVGAGDSFLAAMVFALTQGHPLPEAFRHGVAAGTAALLTPGTELSRIEDVRRLLPEIVAEPL